MSDASGLALNARFYRQVSSCPLKLHYLVREESGNDQGIFYKSESKIMLRRALAVLHPGGKEPDSIYQKAIQQTRDWLKETDVIIYGGVIAWRNYRARLPVLIREGNRLTLLQLHGKLWKPRGRILEAHDLQNQKIMEYAREAAYKKWILSKLYFGMETSVQLCFPNPRFRSVVENLYETLAFNTVEKEAVKSLFIKVNADSAVESVLSGNYAEGIHPFFQGKSFEEQLTWMGGELDCPSDNIPFVITDACKLCTYRNTDTIADSNGCWESHIQKTYLNPKRHVFDLIGYGNDQESSKGNYFQEEVQLPDGVASFEDLSRYSDGTISIQQRRILQLLSSRNKPLPRHWLKKRLVDIVEGINYPLHFVDFEAATSAIPMEVSGAPYKPVLFQFSCHTLHSDGSLDHHQWLDGERRGFPHEEFVRRLTDIPYINEGVIIQYSPFEKQALNNLCREFSSKRFGGDTLTSKLRRLIEGIDPEQGNRFLDMNRLVRDFYYNSEMNYGLGLKQVLLSTLKTSDFLRKLYCEPVYIGTHKIRLIKVENGVLLNPYSLIQDAAEVIDEGSAAMHAWLYTKTPYCEDEKRNRIHAALKRYCTLDSLALVMIFQQWIHVAKEYPGEEDILVWD